MASYLVVKNGTKQKSYECKTTHTAKPYIKVNKTGYLDLTTNTAGFQAKIKHNNQVYRPLQVVHTTTTEIVKTSQTVYSGKSSYYYNYGYSGKYSHKETISKTSYSGYSRTYRQLTYQGSVYPITSGQTYYTRNYPQATQYYTGTTYDPTLHIERYSTLIRIDASFRVTGTQSTSYYTTSHNSYNLYGNVSALYDTNSYYTTSTAVGNLYNTTLATLSGTKLSTKNTISEI